MVEPNSKSKYLIHPSSVRNLSCINFLPLIGSSCSNCQMIGFKYRSYNWKVYKTMKCSQGFYFMLPKSSNADSLFKEIVHYHISHTHHSNSHWLSINSCNKTRYIAFVCVLNSFVILLHVFALNKNNFTLKILSDSQTSLVDTVKLHCSVC